MSTQPANLNRDATGKPTSAIYGDATDAPAGDEWFLPVALRTGAAPELTSLLATAGATGATAVTNPASSASLAAALKGLLTLVNVSTSSQGASAVGTGQTGANASVAATLVAAASKRTWLTAVHVTGLGATAAGPATLTIVGLAGGTRTYDVAVPAGATVAIVPLVIDFAHPIPASADNTVITATLSAFGTGNTLARVNIYGYVR